MEDIRSIISEIGDIHKIPILKIESVSGGDINQAFCLHAGRDKVFLKMNHDVHYPGMLQAEADGLKILESAETCRVPEIVGQGVHKDYQYLLLEWIDSGHPQVDFWEKFGANLAALHRKTHQHFGLAFDNYIGSLRQPNPFSESFIEFFIQYRLNPLVKALREKGTFTGHHISGFELLYSKLKNLIPGEPPALLHGDLWAGNYLISAKGEAILIDPAPYFGHRELDIAMTKLFGGFDRRMYESYNDHFPLQKNWEQRIPLMQLYPLLVHAVLFGGHYVRQCLEIVQAYTK